MIVREVHLYHVCMPLLEPWVTAYGSQDSIESLFVNLKFESGDGWGECAPAPLPLYNSEYTKGAFAAAHDVLLHKLSVKKYRLPTSYNLFFKGSRVMNSPDQPLTRRGGTRTLLNATNLYGH